MKHILLSLILASAFLTLATTPAYAQEQEEPGVIFMLRSADRGTGNDYKQGDIVEVFSDTKPDGSVQRCVLPPQPPFWLVKIKGITKAEADQYMAPQYNPDGSLKNKRGWGIRTNRIPSAYRTFFLAHGFIGFGGPEDTPFYGSIVDGDFAIQWAEVQTWMVQK